MFRKVACPIACLAFLLAAPLATEAQEIEPRTFVNTPVDLNFVAVAYVFQTGNIFVDPSLPLEDIEADIHAAMLRYIRTLSLGGKPAKFGVLFPLVSGHWEGLLEGEFRSRDAGGMGDVRLTLDVLVWGAQARSRGEPPDPDERTIVGAGIAVVLPTGTYDSERLVNPGLNRWAFRPQIGISHDFGKLMLEAIGGVALYGDNDDFFGGQRLTQEPLWLLKTDAVYTFRPGFWLGLGVGYGTGASTRINGVITNTLQTNWRFGGTLAYALAPRHGISVSVLSGLTRRVGADFNNLGFAYQYLW